MKKFLVSVVSFFALIRGRIFAFNFPVESAYGVKEPQPSSLAKVILDILEVAFIPITLLIGVIIFIKFRRKKKNGKGDKDE